MFYGQKVKTQKANRQTLKMVQIRVPDSVTIRTLARAKPARYEKFNPQSSLFCPGSLLSMRTMEKARDAERRTHTSTVLGQAALLKSLQQN